MDQLGDAFVAAVPEPSEPTPEQRKEALDKKWRKLTQRYYVTLETTEGCGARGQGYIDSAYEPLADFARDHPEFQQRLPTRHRCRDDGSFGFGSGLAALASRR